MKKRSLGLLLAVMMLLTTLWLPASLGGIREAEAASEIDWLWPVGTFTTKRGNSGYLLLTQAYMGSYSGGHHYGIDISLGSQDSSPDILAAEAGTVITVATANDKGKYVEISHSNGYCTVYYHLASFSVSKGANVAKGQKIGVMGSTGDSSGRHLHFGVCTGSTWSNSRAINCTPKFQDGVEISMTAIKGAVGDGDWNSNTFSNWSFHYVTKITQTAQNQYLVTYNANGGYGAPASQTKTQGQALTLSSSKPSRSDASAGSYSVTLDANGGSVNSNTLLAKRTTAFSFLSWNTQQNGGGTSYNSGSSYVVDANMTLYAQWSAHISTASITLPTPTRSGYSFGGWYTAASGGTKVGSGGDSYIPSASCTLYAHWIAITCTVYFNADGGTVSPASKTVMGGSPYGELPEPVQEGYTFWGWSDGSRIIHKDTIVEADSDHYLTALWLETVEVTFDLMGGETNEGTNSLVFPGDIYGWLPTPTKEFYEFDGWYTAPSGGIKVTSESIVEQKNDHTLYAHWTNDGRLYIRLDCNGGECSTVAVIYPICPYEIDSILPEPTREGYSFDGWYTEREDGILVTVGTKFYTSQVIYAHWIENAVDSGQCGNNLFWSLDKSGCILSIVGSGPMYDYGSCQEQPWISDRNCIQKIILPYGLTRIGNNSFDGCTKLVSITIPNSVSRIGFNAFYSCDALKEVNYQGTKEQKESVFIGSSNDFLISATWHYNITIFFNADDGSCSQTSKTVVYGSAYGTLPTPTRSGYTFDGWWTTKETGGKQVTASTVCYASGNYTLYARWTPKSYTVTLNPNGGSCGKALKQVTYGQAYGTLPTPTRSGYTFDGWWTAKDSGGKKVTVSTVCYATGNYTLYARWTAGKTYTVTLNPNGGSCGTGSKTVTYGQAYGTLPVPTRKGYTFAGWWTAKDSGGKKVTASTVCYASGNYTLYARWTEGYTMTFNPNGGTVSPTTKVVKYGQQYGALPTPTRAGYTFTGWWTTKAEGGKKVTSTTVCYASAGYTLYARWTPKKFVITLNPNGGECATATKTVTYGQAYGTMPVPSPRTGYTFSGWWTAKTGGKQVTASTVCYATGNYTLYARWTPKTYTITFNANGGSCSTTSKKVTYGQTYGTLPSPTRAGYQFAGWWTTKDSGGKQVFSSTVCYATGNYTLYARWWVN